MQNWLKNIWVGDVITVGIGVVYAGASFVITIMNIVSKIIKKYNGYPIFNHPMLLSATSNWSYFTINLTIAMLRKSWMLLLHLAFFNSPWMRLFSTIKLISWSLLDATVERDKICPWLDLVSHQNSNFPKELIGWMEVSEGGCNFEETSNLDIYDW